MKEESPAEEVLESVSAEVWTVSTCPWPTFVRSQGSLYPDEESVVGAKVAGRVAEVHVDLGDRVAAGDPLVTLDREEFRLEIAQAEAQLQQTRSAVGLLADDDVEQLVPENAAPVREAKAVWEEAKSSLDRATKLRAQDAVARGEYEQAAATERVSEARFASALNSVREKIALIGVRQAELQLARQRFDDAVIAAPLDGYVQRRHVAQGNYISVGQPIAIIVRTQPLRFRGTVPERYAQLLDIGQTVRLQIESVTRSYEAEITRVSPALDQQSRALVFEAEIDNRDHDLRTGLFVEAEVVIDPDATALIIPGSALTEFAGTQKVWKVIDGVAAEQEVLAGARRDDEREILSGLTAGDRILRDGSKGRVARIVPRQAADSENDVPDNEDVESDDTANEDGQVGPKVSETP